MRKLREWKWGILKPYNGFSHVERVHVWQLQSFFTDNGWWERPKVCSITGRMDRVAWHSEDYADWPNSSFPIQQGVHLTLHARFRNPRAWLDIVEKHAVTGTEWFADLSMTPVDLATTMRARFPADAGDVFDRAPVPEGIVIPRNQIYRQPQA